MVTVIPQWQVDMAARPAPDVPWIVGQSTPVISFGDPLRADVATLGINPSRREFYGIDGMLLSGPRRRLATTESIGARPGEPLTMAQARSVVADCNEYFERNPYTWFGRLEELLNAAVGGSYYDRSACHLDLIQWATDPVWGKLGDPVAARLLLDEGRPHLLQLLDASNVHVVLLNGASVINQVRKIGVSRLRAVTKIPRGNGYCTLYAGHGCGATYVGWSTNLQTSFGVSNNFRRRLAGDVAVLVENFTHPAPALPKETVPSDVQIYDGGFLPRGLEVNGKRELADLLHRWLRESDAKTIGNVGSFGGAGCITVHLGNQRAVLNVDTKRAAVETYLDRVRRFGPDLPWHVIANNRGTVNKVVFSEDPGDAPGWYLYLRAPLPQPGSL